MNSTRFSRRPFLGVLAVLSLCSPSIVRAAPAQAQAGQIGVVDEDKLSAGFKRYAAAVAAIDKRAQDLDAKIPAREFLSGDEGKNYDALIVNTSLSAPQSTQLDTLVKTGIGRKKEYVDLVGKAVRTEQETKRMQILQGYATQNGPQLRQLSDQLLQSVRAQQDATDKQFTDQAISAVAQVAQSRGFLLIVRKQAVFYSADAVDVTTEVLNRLNK